MMKGFSFALLWILLLSALRCQLIPVSANLPRMYDLVSHAGISHLAATNKERKVLFYLRGGGYEAATSRPGDPVECEVQVSHVEDSVVCAPAETVANAEVASASSTLPGLNVLPGDAVDIPDTRRMGGNAAGGVGSPGHLAAAALQARLASSARPFWKPEYVGGESPPRREMARSKSELELGQEALDMHRVRVTRVKKFQKKEPSARFKAKIHKGIPKSEWGVLLHSTKCRFVDSTGNTTCSKDPLFGDPKTGRALFCKAHKLPGHTDVKTTKWCMVADCFKHPVFGEVGTNMRKYCADHKTSTCVDLTNRRCQSAEGCEKQATFGEEKARAATFCIKHKLPEHVNVRKTACIFPSCNSFGTFGDLNGRPRWCARHKGDDMVNRVSKLCKYPHGCHRCPSFGSPLDQRIMYCKVHKVPGDINIRIAFSSRPKATCKHEGCTVGPKFGDPVTRKAEFCRKHSPAGSVDVANKQCEGQGCLRRALFAKPLAEDSKTRKRKQKPSFCAKHKSEGDVDVFNRRCEMPRCNKHPSYGNEGMYRPTYCGEHRLPNHVYIFKPKPRTRDLSPGTRGRSCSSGLEES